VGMNVLEAQLVVKLLDQMKKSYKAGFWIY